MQGVRINLRSQNQNGSHLKSDKEWNLEQIHTAASLLGVNENDAYLCWGSRGVNGGSYSMIGAIVVRKSDMPIPHLQCISGYDPSHPYFVVEEINDLVLAAWVGDVYKTLKDVNEGK